MKKQGNDPLQEELRSSQIYKTLTGSGIPMAGKIAQGLGKAAQGLDQALNLGRNAGHNAGNGHPYQAPPAGGTYRPPTQGTYPGPQQTAPPNRGKAVPRAARRLPPRERIPALPGKR